MADPVTAATFDIVRHAPDALLDVWAPWCAPCRALTPVLERVAAEAGLPLYALNADTDGALAQALGVRSLPTVLRFQHGRLVAAAVGAQPAERLRMALGLRSAPPHP